MLRRIREVLIETVLPEIRSDYARTQLEYLLLALGDLASADGLYPRLSDENEDLEALLEAILRDLTASGAPGIGELAAEIAAVSKRVTSRRGSGGMSPSLAETERKNRELRGCLEQIIRVLDRSERMGQSFAAVTEARRRIRVQLRKYLDRDASLGVVLPGR